MQKLVLKLILQRARHLLAILHQAGKALWLDAQLDNLSMRIALGLEYDGSAYHGWQRQTNAPAVQNDLERALSRVALHPVRTSCAGRTDKGVHALNQVVHFDTEAIRDARAWIKGTNTFLKASIRVKWAQEVSSAFNARHAALARRYRYIIYNHPQKPAILRQNMSWFYHPLNIDLMREAAHYLIGKHDFTSFQGPHCQSPTPIRRVQEISLSRQAEMITIDIQANAFLHNMVRNIVGLLYKIGQGIMPANWALEVLHARERRLGFLCAPAEGLYLTHVIYPEPWIFPQHELGPSFLLGA